MSELRLPKYAIGALNQASEVIREEHGYDYWRPLVEAYDNKDGEAVLRALRKALGQSRIDYSVTRWGDDYRLRTTYAGNLIVNVHEMLTKINEGDRARARTLAANANANYKRWKDS